MAPMDQRTVLVVEDDAAIRTLIAELLDEAGYAVLEAACGRQALRLAHEHVPSVVLVDHRLPDMSGLDLLERLRTRPTSRYIPVMLVTGLAHRLVDRDHGADRVLSKPFDIGVLLEQVDALASSTRDGVASFARASRD
jgi:DNA-binding response OmpR family regulator